jgi:ABC-type multidrug transport system fused ATPase/permease subunit
MLGSIVEPCAGQLCIDGVNILELPLHVVRNAIAIVPQVMANCRLIK